MKAGKIASLSLALAMTALSAVVWRGLPAIPWLEGMSPVLRLALLYGILGFLFIALLMPFGIWLDRSIADLRRYIESAASSDPPVTFSGPPWLRPITRALAGAVDSFGDVVAKAATARRPRTRYYVPFSANLQSRFLGYLPDSVLDRLLMKLYKVPVART